MSSLLDESVTWAEFGRRHLDRRVSKALTASLGLERPTLVQSRGIPVALEGKDLLCRARTGSGKTLCYAVPLVQRLLAEAEAKGSSTPMAGLVLVPTKELIAQVHGVITSLLSFCFDMLTAEPLLSGQTYSKAELPSILVTTPSSLAALVHQRRGTMTPLSDSLKMLVVDEADLMFSFGYESDVRALCAMLPATYQAMLVSATLSEEVEQLKGLMLHKPVVLKLEEPRVTGKLSQFYLSCHKADKYLILYTLLKLQLVQGKILLFVKSIDAAYKLKIFLERFAINSAVLNAELPHATRQNIIQAYNQSMVELLIATDAGLAAEADEEEGEPPEEEDEAEVEVEDAAEEEAAEPPKKKRKLKKKKKKAEEAEAAEDVAEEPAPKKAKTTTKAQADAAEEAAAEAPSAKVEVQRAPAGGRRRRKADEQYSITRGVDLQGVSTVINADVPTSCRDYVHRVGRAARGGASGTALTLSSPEEEPQLQRILRAQEAGAGSGALRPLPMQLADAERFRYRVEDMARGLTKRAIEKYRARELQLEALNSEKLKAYFEEHPEERRALQKTQRQLRERKSVRSHLRTVPSYLVPENFSSATPVQQAVRDDLATQGPSGAGKRRRRMETRKQDPLQVLPISGKDKNRRFTRQAMEARERKIDPNTANLEDLPALSGRKLWKLRHGKKVMPQLNQLGERKRATWGTKKRMRKFGF